MPTHELKEAFNFHRELSACVVGEHAKAGLKLARAELMANRSDRIEFSWIKDRNADRGPIDWGWDAADVARWDREEHTVQGCILRIDGEPDGSLWGIWDATDDYRRTVEAELAAEFYAGLGAL